MRDASGNQIITRVVSFFCWYGVWLVFAGGSGSNAVVGIPAAVLAAWVNMILFPTTRQRFSLTRMARYSVDFLWQTAIAGVDVAWRVFHPKIPLRPGIVRLVPQIPVGTRRSLFCGLASLQPGSLACGVDDEGNLLFHCLDTTGDGERALMRAQAEFVKMSSENRS